MSQNKPAPLVGIVVTVLSVLLILGILTFAGPCGVHNDGTVGSCYWASRAVLGVGVVLFVLSVVRIFERDEGERRGLSLAIASLGALAACMPGALIDLCAVQTMRCNAVMRPFVLVVGIALAVLGAVDLVMRLRAIGRRKAQ